MAPLLGIILVSLAVGVAVFLLVMLASGLIKLIGVLLRHIWRFVSGEILDIFRFVGSVLLFPVLAILTVGSVVVGRWSAAAHYGRAITSEMKTAALCLYRCALGHPLKFIGLGVVMEGLEQRLPELVAAAPTSDKPRRGGVVLKADIGKGAKRAGQFDGYKIVGSLPGGGSGAKLYIAEPDEIKRAAFERAGQHDVEQVVIKVFSLDEGSSLPQIIRESRSLEAARKLGLVLEHELNDQRFFYAMRFVPGDQLTLVTQRIHAEAGPEGLSEAQIRRFCGYAVDLLETLRVYHGGGLWHKDVKPDNIIVDPTGAHLVDLGLITPLRSAMTLTTHGTEYFRDPELVRMALKGVKVHQVNGAKFDVYAAGAVLYAMLENSFPAHGGLSQLVKPCPEALRWIVRRAMTEYDKRYESCDEMLADLRVVLAGEKLAGVKPADLPSMTGETVIEAEPDLDPLEVAKRAKAASPVPPREPQTKAPPRPEPVAAASAARSGAPRLRVSSWWSGKYEMDAPGAPAPAPAAAAHAKARRAPARAAVPVQDRRPASEQLATARARMAERRNRARSRLSPSKRGARPGMNSGVVVAIAAVLGVLAIPATVLTLRPATSERSAQVIDEHIDAASDAHNEFAAGLETAINKSINATKAALASAAVPYKPSGSEGRVLVVSDFQLPMDQQLASDVRAAIVSLNRGGFETLGDLNEREIPNLQAIGWEIDMIARARKIRAQRPLDSTETMRDLREWVRAQADADAILWLAPEPDGQGGANSLVLAAGDKRAVATTLTSIDPQSLYQAAADVCDPVESPDAPHSPVLPGVN